MSWTRPPIPRRISALAFGTVRGRIGYPTFRSPFEGINSLPATAEGRETFDATLYAGVRLWRGAELWFNPEVDQGFGLADTHGTNGQNQTFWNWRSRIFYLEQGDRVEAKRYLEAAVKACPPSLIDLGAAKAELIRLQSPG
jgi:hypothetical protein